MKNSHRVFSRSMWLALLLTVALGGMGVAFAQGRALSDDDSGRPGRRGGQGRFGERCGDTAKGDRLAARLDLTAEQREGVREIKENGRTRDLGLRKQMMRLRHEIRGEMLKDQPSEKTVTGLSQKLGDLRTEVQIGHMHDRLAIGKLLTPEQRDKMLMSGGPRGGGCGR